jgi:nicotinamide-nucleotide amidase
MHSRIVAVGDELILGRTVDTNSTWLAQRLAACGCPCAGVQVVGDAEDAIVAAIHAAVADASLVIVTGGLGPTEDDRTRHALARAMDVDLVDDPRAWRQILAWYRRVRPDLTPAASNRRQALLPRGAAILANDRGTAPGLLARLGGARVACLPGVPHEMRAMFDRLADRLPRLLPGLVPPTVGEVWFAGTGESAAQDRLVGVLNEADPMVGITVSDNGHITIRAVGTPAQVRTRLARARRAMRDWLLPAPGLAPSLVGLLTRRRQTITAAESCTGGRIAAALTAVPGASAVLRQAVVAYHGDAKQALLGVPADLLRVHGEVSEETVRAMAEGARRAAGADLAVAASGIAGPGGGSRAKPVGTVWIAACDRRRTIAKLLTSGGDRERIQRHAANQALLLAWQLANG